MVCLQLYLYPNNHPFMLLMFLMSRPGLDHPEEDFSARLQEAVGAAVPGPEPAPGVRQGDAREIRRPRPKPRPRHSPRPQEQAYLALGGQEVLRDPGGGRDRQQGDPARVVRRRV